MTGFQVKGNQASSAEHMESQDSGSEGTAGPNTARSGNSQATLTEVLLDAKHRGRCEIL